MGIGTLSSATDIQANLTQTLLGGKLQEADMAMKIAKVGMEMQIKAQEMATQQQVVAMMTGVGGKLNAYV